MRQAGYVMRMSDWSSDVCSSDLSFVWWPWLSLALTLLWLTTLCAWWLHVRALRKSAAPRAKPERKTATAGDARKAFAPACRHHDPLGAQSEPLNWVGQTDTADRQGCG